MRKCELPLKYKIKKYLLGVVGPSMHTTRCIFCENYKCRKHPRNAKYKGEGNDII